VALDGQPLFGISVFAVVDTSLDDLLRRRFTSFRMIYLPTAGSLAEHRFELLPTGQRPHFTVRLQQGTVPSSTGCWKLSVLRNLIPSTLEA
jgi:hypothetical protein